MLVGFNFNPVNWMYCNGAVLAIQQYQALFSLIGTTYGGNGQTTFALPDLRGRAPLGYGQGPGLTDYRIGSVFGTETVNVTTANMPSHTHTAQLAATSIPATQTSPGGALLAAGGAYATGVAADGQLAGVTVASTGGSQPVGVIQPSLALNFVICVNGLFPSRG
ncbi:MAG: phage tail protein [Kofleriaceae bacterium]|nr:phage tail protein [Myxococcales bacterium]MCB9562036.1 phage tail protein [Kofleriaceae bacterium]